MGYNFGIVGLGLIADFHAQAIQSMPKAQVVAGVDISEERVAAFSKKFGCQGYASLPEMLKHPGLDIVTICTPSGYHMESALQVIKAGKHVIVEKPLEVTLEKCDAIIDAARQQGVRVATIFPSRFHETSQAIKKAVDCHRFGTITMADAYVKWYRSQEYYDKGGWHGTKAVDGGGALMNQSIHAIDLLQWFMGPVHSVHAYTDMLGHEGVEVEDTAVAILRFRNGAMGVIEGSTAVFPGYLKRIEIGGTEGSVILEESALKSWSFKDETDEDERIRKEFFADADSGGGASDPAAISFKPHQLQFEEFIDSLESGRPSMVEDSEGRRAVEIILAIYESARSGSEVLL